jgi:protein TonB
MTAFGVGARSGSPERARFIRALLASLLLHGLVLAPKAGPASGVRANSLSDGGVIHAVLRRAPAATVPESPPNASFQPALLAATPETYKPPIATEPVTRSTVASTEPPVTIAHPTKTAEVPGLRDDGRDAAPGAASSGGESLAIPLLPPMTVAAPEVQGRPALKHPLNFSYPSNLRIQGGRVRVRILLDEKGEVEEMRTLAAVPPGVFEQAAIEVLRAGRFAPGYAGPISVRSYLFMEVTFGPGPEGQKAWYAGSAFAPPSSNRR